MAVPSAHPFRETIHRPGDTVGTTVLAGQALEKLERELAGEPGLISVRGCRSGAGVSFLLEAAMARSPVLPIQVDGLFDMGWSGLRQAAGRPSCAEKLVPALLGRLLATVVRGGLLPSTDPEMVAMQMESESARVLDFAKGTPMTRWLIEREEIVGPALARRLQTLALPDSDAFLSSMLVWVKARSQGERPGWNPPGNSDKERVRSLALAASASGLPLVWVFDGLDPLAFETSALPAFWRRIAVLVGTGNRVVVAASDALWRGSLEPCLPAAWRERLSRRTVRLEPLDPASVRQLLAERLAAAGSDLPGLPEWVVTTALPLGGTPREALVEARMFWDLHRLQPVSPLESEASGERAMPSGHQPGETPTPPPGLPWVEGLLAAAVPLPFIEAAPLVRPGLPRALIVRTPGLWVLVCSCPTRYCREKMEEEARALQISAPEGTTISITQLSMEDSGVTTAPPTWNHVWLDNGEKAALIEIAAGRSLWPSDASEALGRLWERLTRPPAIRA